MEQLVAYSGKAIVIDDVLAVLGAADADLLFGTIDAISAGDARSALLAAARLADSGRDLGRFFGDLEAHARGLLVTQVLGAVPSELEVTPEQDERLAEQARRVGGAELVRLLELIAIALRAMKDGADPRTQLELALVKAAKPDLEPTVKALQERIARLESNRAAAAPAPVRTPAVAETPAGRAAAPPQAAPAAPPPQSAPPHGRAARRRAAIRAAGAPGQAAPPAAAPAQSAPPPAPARPLRRRHAVGRAPPSPRTCRRAVPGPPSNGAPAQPAPAHSAPSHGGRAEEPPPHGEPAGVTPITARRSRNRRRTASPPSIAGARTCTSRRASTASRSRSPRRCPGPGTRRPARRSTRPTTWRPRWRTSSRPRTTPRPPSPRRRRSTRTSPPPAASLELSLARFGESWPAIIEELREGTPMLAAALEDCAPAALSDDGLTLAWPESSSFLKRKAEDPANRDLLVRAIRSVTGSSLRLAYELRSDSDPLPAMAAAAAATPKLSEEDLVQRFMEEFDAEELPPDPEEQT